MAIASGALLIISPAAAADAKFPPLVKIVVPFGPGGSNDVVARALAAPLAKRLETNVIVDNKAGASGIIGNDVVAKSPRDGSVLLLTSSTFLTVAATQAKLPYDPLADFVPITLVGDGPMLLAVSSAFAVKTPAEYIAAARAKPGSIESRNGSDSAMPAPRRKRRRESGVRVEINGPEEDEGAE